MPCSERTCLQLMHFKQPLMVCGVLAPSNADASASRASVALPYAASVCVRCCTTHLFRIFLHKPNPSIIPKTALIAEKLSAQSEENNPKNGKQTR